MLALAGRGRDVARGGPDVSRRLAVAGRRPQERGRGRPAAASRFHRAAGRAEKCSSGHSRGPHGYRRRGGIAASGLGFHAVPTAGTGNGLAPAQVEAEIAAVPEPQKAIAAMLPLGDLPPGWTQASREPSTSNVQRRQPLREDRRPRRELPPVRGQGHGLRLLPPDRRPVQRAAALHLRDGRCAQGPGQVRLGEARRGQGRAGRRRGLHRRRQHALLRRQVLHPDRLDAGRPQVRCLRAGAGQARRRQAKAGRQPCAGGGRSRHLSRPWRRLQFRPPNPRRRPRRFSPPPPIPRPRSPPRRYFAFLPAAGKQGDPKYVAQDVFGYSFLSDVFMADYKEGDVTWQGFLRPYRDAKEAKAVLEKYVAGVKKDGAEVKTLTAEGADEMVVSTNIGLVDVVFRKGNTLAGANGATSQAGRGLPGLPRACRPTVPCSKAATDASLSTRPRSRVQVRSIRPRSDDGRKTDPDADEEPGAASAGSTRPTSRFRAGSSSARSAATAWWPAARSAPGSCSATAGAWRGSSRRRRCG